MTAGCDLFFALRVIIRAIRIACAASWKWMCVGIPSKRNVCVNRSSMWLVERGSPLLTLQGNPSWCILCICMCCSQDHRINRCFRKSHHIAMLRCNNNSHRELVFVCDADIVLSDLRVDRASIALFTKA